jgi:prepilin-type N-terminal cleavage/methylation domain-containing protein
VRASDTRTAGFTLVEVMIALSLLGLALVVVMKSSASNIFYSQDAHMIGVTTELARGKMYDLEETLAKEGFSDSNQDKNGDFADEGWPAIKWEAKVEEVQLPGFEQLQALTKGQAGKLQGQRADALKAAAGGATAPGPSSQPLSLAGKTDDKCSDGADPNASFQDSALGGLLGTFGGGDDGSVDAASAKGGGFIQSQFKLFQDLLKASIRKVTLTLKWEVMGRERDMKVVAYFTDPGGLTKVMGAIGASAPAGGAP